jgi:hypothetical protein
MCVHLNHLGGCLLHRFKNTENLTDISEAISSLQKAVQLTSEGHAKMPCWLNNLGNLFARHRFKHTGDLTDISEAISSGKKQFNSLLMAMHTCLTPYLKYLGNSFVHRFRHTGDLTDISKGISSLQKAVQLTPEGNVKMHSHLHDLGRSFKHRFEYTRDLADIFEAISSQQKAVQLTPEGHADISIQLKYLGISFFVLL